jgi:hypothetical protein
LVKCIYDRQRHLDLAQAIVDEILGATQAEFQNGDLENSDRLEEALRVTGLATLREISGIAPDVEA